MWTRKELKTRGKQTFKLNYWKTVLISILLAAILGGMSGAGAAGSGSSALVGSSDEAAYNYEEDGSSVTITGEDGTQITLPNIPGLDSEDITIGQAQGTGNIKIPTYFGVAMVAVFLIVFLVIALVAILVNAFLFNPLEVGARRFFTQNLHTAAEVKEVAYGYDHGYKNIVKTLLLRDIYLILWFLLFIIPGIIKAYEYRMIPYILADHPEMPAKEAFARSKALMSGQKWRAFVLDLSFFGWDILSLLTLGMLGIFYVGPYHNMTNAALYEALEYGGWRQESVVWDPDEPAPIQ